MYKTVLWIIIIFFVVSTYMMIANYKDLSVAVPANLKAKVTLDPFQGWREFTFDQENFSVKFPAIPQNAKDTVTNNAREKVLYNMYVSEKWNGAIFVVTVISYPHSIADGDTKNTLKGFLAETLITNPQNELVSASESQFQGHEAIDFVIQNPQALIDGKAFVEANKIYFLSYVTEEHNREPKDYTYFIESFRLL